MITEKMWEDIWDNARKITVCNQTRAMQLKILHRAHVAPNRLSKYRKDVSPFSLKCRTGIGDLTYFIMSYVKIQKYWSDEIRKVLKKVAEDNNGLSDLMPLKEYANHSFIILTFLL